MRELVCLGLRFADELELKEDVIVWKMEDFVVGVEVEFVFTPSFALSSFDRFSDAESLVEALPGAAEGDMFVRNGDTDMSVQTPTYDPLPAFSTR